LHNGEGRAVAEAQVVEVGHTLSFCGCIGVVGGFERRLESE